MKRLCAWLVALSVLSGCSTTPEGAAGDRYRRILADTQAELRHAFHEIHEGVEAAAQRLAATGLTGEPAIAVLERLCGGNAHAFDCATVDARGIIVAVVPQEYGDLVGADIASQEQIVRLHTTRQPVVSQAIDTVEGFEGFDFEHPVLGRDGELIGSVSILSEPGFFGHVIDPVVRNHPVEMWVMQTDGRIVYDPNPEEIGRNLFKDDLYAQYPSLVAVGRQMAGTREGSGHYRFLDQTLNQAVEKRLLWTTIELHGTEFRIALAHETGG